MKKTAVITGATSGLGLDLAYRLARRGFRLVLPCRSLQRADALRTAVSLQVPGAELDFVLCDLSDLAAVKRCGDYIASRHPVIDLFVANAATLSPRKQLTAQGLELTFAVNHLAHFVLFQWLAGNLYTHSRVITVASSGARWGRPAFLDDLNYRRHRYRMFRAYANSKLANIAFADQCARRLAKRQIASVSVHPGMLATGIWPQGTPLQRLLVPVLKRLYLMPPEQGGEVLEYFAIAPEHNESRGYFNEKDPSPPPRAMTAAFADRLWQLSLDLGQQFLPERVL